MVVEELGAGSRSTGSGSEAGNGKRDSSSVEDNVDDVVVLVSDGGAGEVVDEELEKVTEKPVYSSMKIEQAT